MPPSTPLSLRCGHRYRRRPPSHPPQPDQPPFAVARPIDLQDLAAAGRPPFVPPPPPCSALAAPVGAPSLTPPFSPRPKSLLPALIWPGDEALLLAAVEENLEILSAPTMQPPRSSKLGHDDGSGDPESDSGAAEVGTTGADASEASDGAAELYGGCVHASAGWVLFVRRQMRVLSEQYYWS
ncbi:hypothetical protein PR202_ga22254 [Eleusine coracana subsp. coracana]|uniref:Uncharacterized protein n=1 Tax=Eleusine coracana subsp. coracana TaxID=191504 RepID=A0AAV5D3E9_ELECO|nr:hypothetical protein PR202_ga22254 [Eleusine coracana subsp. coracana]